MRSFILMTGSALMLASACAFAQSSTTASTDTQRAAERRAREFADLINAHDPVSSQEYVRQSFGPDMQKIPMDRHLAIFSQLRDQTRGFTFDH
jgi:hypothetical protein